MSRNVDRRGSVSALNDATQAAGRTGAQAPSFSSIVAARQGQNLALGRYYVIGDEGTGYVHRLPTIASSGDIGGTVSIRNIGTQNATIVTMPGISILTNGNSSYTVENDGYVVTFVAETPNRYGVIGNNPHDVNVLTISAAGPSDNVDVTGVDTIIVDSSAANVTIGGFTGGVNGQVIHIVKKGNNYFAILEHSEAPNDQKIFLSNNEDDALQFYGGWTLVCDGSNWYEARSRRGGWQYVDIGDVNAAAYVVGNFTCDNSWHDLDVSGIVGQAQRLVNVRAAIVNTTPVVFYLRNPDFGNLFNLAAWTSPPSGTTRTQCTVLTNSNGYLEYFANTTPTTLNVTILGWWKFSEPTT